MSDGGQKKRKSKSWYRKQAFHNKRHKTDGKPGHRLAPGLKGFIITCNDHERDAVKESYNILNEYADKLYGPEVKEDAEDSGGSDADDIEKAIAKEVQSLKDIAAKGERRFQNSQTGAKNCIFIKTTVDDPADLAHAIFTDLLQSKVQKSRYALRLLPVVGTCKANIKEITELAESVLKPFFIDTKFETTYTINFKARNNSGVGREMAISSVRKTITETFPSVLLRYTPVNPQITILVEVMCGVACIAVARDFTRFRKYNLVEVVSEKQTPTVPDVEVKNTDESERVAAEESIVTGTEEEADSHKQEEEAEAGAELDTCDVDNDSLPAGKEEVSIDAAVSSGQENSFVPVEAGHDDAGEGGTVQENSACTAEITEQAVDSVSQAEITEQVADSVSQAEITEQAADSVSQGEASDCTLKAVEQTTGDAAFLTKTSDHTAKGGEQDTNVAL